MKKHGGFLWWIVWVLVLIGGLNWGLVGFFDFNLVSYLFVDLWPVPVVEKIIYDVVGVAAVVMLVMSFACCGKGKCCKAE